MPRRGLTRQQVVGEAAALADEVGLGQLTLAAVAKRLGVSLPALYKHVDGLDGLHRDLALLGVRELTAGLSAATIGRSGGDALRGLARAYRDYGTAHPGRCAASVRAPAPGDAEHQAAGAAAVAVLEAALGGYGLADDDLIHAVRAVRVTLHGFVALEREGGFGLPQSVEETLGRLVDALDASFARRGRAATAGRAA